MYVITEDVFRHYKIDYPELDKEHWDILASIDGVFMPTNVDDALCQINKTHSLWITHSRGEEAFMAKVNFPYAIYHCEDHILSLTNRIMALEEYVQHSRHLNISHAASNLQKIILAHIDTYDLQITAWINSNKTKRSN